MNPNCPVCLQEVPSGPAGELARCRRCSSQFLPPGASALPIHVAPPDGPEKVAAHIELPRDFLARYELKQKLGAGAMGMVMLAYDRTTERPVAIKVQLEAGNKDVIERLLREGRAMARIRHPSVVAVYDMVEVDGHVCLITEYLEGGTLRERLRERQRLAAGDAVRIAVECLEGLEACHAAGVVHRDIKPENILFDAADGAHVADLGLARDANAQAMTQAGVLLGTPRYWAPEQARGDRATPAADVYAIGAILHEMLAGKAVFNAPNLAQLMHQQIAEPPPPLEAEGIAAPLAVAVRHALEKQPELRPASAAEYARELQEALRAAARPRATARTKAVTAREPAAAPTLALATPRGRGAAVAVFVLLLAGAAAMTRRFVQPPEPPPSAPPTAAATAVASAPDLSPLAARIRELDEAVLSYGTLVQPQVRRHAKEEPGRHAALKGLEARGARLAADLEDAQRKLSDARGGAALALEAWLALLRFDGDVLRTQVRIALAVVPWTSPDPVQIALGVIRIRVEAKPEDVARYKRIVEQAGRVLAEGSADATGATPSRFLGVFLIRRAGWVVQRFDAADAIRREAKTAVARCASDVEREVPPPLGALLAAAARAAWAFGDAQDDRTREETADRYVAPLLAVLASAPGGAAPELERERTFARATVPRKDIAPVVGPARALPPALAKRIEDACAVADRASRHASARSEDPGDECAAAVRGLLDTELALELDAGPSPSPAHLLARARLATGRVESTLAHELARVPGAPTRFEHVDRISEAVALAVAALEATGADAASADAAQMLRRTGTSWRRLSVRPEHAGAMGGRVRQHVMGGAQRRGPAGTAAFETAAMAAWEGR